MKILNLGLALGLFATTTFAYELSTPACKKVDFYEPIFGKCDTEGRLQGSGATMIGNLLIHGQYAAGLPKGKMKYGFVDQSSAVYGIKLHSNGDVDSLAAFIQWVTQSKKGDGIDYSRVSEQYLKKMTFCEIVLEGNIISQNKFQCVAPLGNNNTLSYTIKPLTSKGYIKSKGELELDESEIILQNNKQSFVGVADGILITNDHVFLKGFKGKATNQMTSYSGTKDSSGMIQGYFDVKCNWQYCGLTQKTAKLEGQKISADFLTTQTLFGKTYQYVRMPNSGSSTASLVYYFKNPDGLEFDASVITSPEQCKYGTRNRQPGALLVTKDIDNGRAKILDIKPECGRITTPDGKSFTGAFDHDGRPVRE